MIMIMRTMILIMFPMRFLSFFWFIIKTRTFCNLGKNGIAEIPNSNTQTVNQPVNISPEQPDGKVSAWFDGLIDLVEHNGEVAFLVKDGDKFVVDTSYTNHESRIFVPPPHTSIPFLLPRIQEVEKYYQQDIKRSNSKADAKLFDDLVAYHKNISELPSDEYYLLLAAWDMHTYMQESVQYSPMICMFAEAERGKSRTGKGMVNVAYRGIHLETVKEAHLIRFSNVLHAIMFFDVMDLWKKVSRNTSEDILLQRFEKGAYTFRVFGGSNGSITDLTRFEIFGPTIIGTNEELHKILDTRAIHMTMTPSTKTFETDVTREIALPYKERLVSFRARHYKNELPMVTKLNPGRLGDILKPLHQIIMLVRPEKEKQFLKLVQEIQERKATDKMVSLEAMIVNVILRLRNHAHASHGVVGVKQITDSVNEAWDYSSGGNLTPQKIGRKLLSLGFQSARMSNGNAGILYQQTLIDKLSSIYALQAA